jgi:SH3-like domain-containing protein
MMLPPRRSPLFHRQLSRLAIVVVAIATALTGWSGPLTAGSTATTTDRKGASGLSLPRYVSLRSDRINLRAGPGTEYPTTWVFRRAGLPVEVFEEFENWRHVRDSEGTEGWIYASLLSGRRTALILPWDRKKQDGQAVQQVAIYADDDLPARKVAIVEPGVIANIHTCNQQWCDVSIDRYRGFIQQNKLWGVYPKERIN